MAVGETTFARNALAFVNERLSADHVALFVLDHELVPHFIDGASREGAPTAQIAGRLYERSQFYKRDPNSKVITTGTGEEDVMIFRQRATDITDSSYRELIYQRFNLLERVSAIRTVAGCWFVFSLYRDIRSQLFSPSEMTGFTEMAALLVTCTAKHFGLVRKQQPLANSVTRPQQYLETLLSTIEPRLTRREREVCAMSLAGHGSESIAAALKVMPSTVATLRNRAYGRLNINKVNELFALCIEKIASDSSPM
jgi:DNA-binding CsgD family transcriptional regulator